MTESRHQSKHLIKVGMSSQKINHTRATYLPNTNSNWLKHQKKCSNSSDENYPEINSDPGTQWCHQHLISPSTWLCTFCGLHYLAEPSCQVNIFGEFQASTPPAQQFCLGENVFPRCIRNSFETESHLPGLGHMATPERKITVAKVWFQCCLSLYQMA